MKKMEIDLRYTSKKHKVNAIYGMIDVEAVMSALKVKTYKGIEALFGVSGTNCRTTNRMFLG